MKYIFLPLCLLLTECTTYNDSHDIVYSPSYIVGNEKIPKSLPTNNNWKWNKRLQNEKVDNDQSYIRHRSIYN